MTTSFTVEIIYLSAYALFLVGASRSFRDYGSRAAVLLMTVGYIANVCIGLASMTGIGFFKVAGEGAGGVIFAAVVFGILTIWLPFPVALILRRFGKQKLFHCLIAVIEVCWFINIILLINGLYRVPVQ